MVRGWEMRVPAVQMACSIVTFSWELDRSWPVVLMPTAVMALPDLAPCWLAPVNRT